MRPAYVAFGSNIEPERNVARAIQQFTESGELRDMSPLYRSRAIGGGPEFVNGVFVLHPQEREAIAFIDKLRHVEEMLGRVRTADKFAPRVIDLDLVAWPGHEHPRLPHPDIEKYSFVAHPLAYLAPGLRVRSGAKVVEVAARLGARELTRLTSLEQGPGRGVREVARK